MYKNIHKYIMKLLIFSKNNINLIEIINYFMYKLYIFDLDGTLSDSRDGITRSYQYALKQFGIEQNDIDILAKHIGPSIHDVFREHYGIQDTKKAEKHFRNYYVDKGIFEHRMYEGVDKLFMKLENKKVALATSKPYVYAKKILASYGIDKYFDVVYGSNLDGTKSMKKDLISNVLNEFDFSNDEVVMVGDRSYDIEGAKQNGISSIGVTYGYGTKEELLMSGADMVLDTVNMLYNYL